MHRDAHPAMDPPAPLFSELLERRLTRRDILKAGAAVAAGMAVGPLAGSHPAVADGPAAPRPDRSGTTGLGFKALQDVNPEQICVPDGYRAVPLIRWGDPLRPGLDPFDIDSQTARGQQERFGFSNDFIGFFPLAHDGGTGRALLWVNHENSMGRFMFRHWDCQNPTEEQVRIAQASLGGTVVEVFRKADGNWDYDPTSPYNRRVTAATPIRLTGPAAGCSWLRTKADPTGRLVLGTFANCAGGVTPWGTVLSAEENFDLYFNMGEYIGSEDPDAPVACAHRQYYKEPSNKGIDVPAWHKCDPRFDVFDEPNEPFRFGWIVEIDPYDPASVPRKRTALGRFKHEGAVTTLASDGRAVVYSGEDEEDKYVYKFVSRRPVDLHDRSADWDVLDEGTLYAARFSDDGTGVWLPLRFGFDPLVPDKFVSQADVLVRARVAAYEVKATPMDRAEDIEVSPVNGRIYMALTKNTNRNSPSGCANPRLPNSFGHVIELIEDGHDAAATSFTWDIFLLCGKPADLVTNWRSVDFTKPEAEKTSYFAGYGHEKGLSPIANPDNLAFDRAGNLWIATDGQEEVLESDVREKKRPDALHAVPTWGCERGRVQQFLSAVKGAEVTGPCFTPANDALFVSIQHPGREGSNNLACAGHWPDGDGRPARPSVVVVTKHGGGTIGS